MRLSDPYYYCIEASLNTFLIAFLKSLLISTKADLLCFMLANLIPHMPQLSSNIIINKHYRYISEHFMLALVLVIVFYLISTKENNLKVFC